MWTLEDYPKLNTVRQKIVEIKGEIPKKYLREQDSSLSDYTGFVEGRWSYNLAYIPEWFNPRWFSETLQLTNEEVQTIKEKLKVAFPTINQIMKHLPDVDYAGFSTLHARSRLNAHSHHHKKDTRQMLMLLNGMPAGCGLSSEDKIFNWQKAGDVVIFDQTKEHASWNSTDKDRVCFYVNFTPKF